jgi:tetratricopeptide (TPR) repeat protein
MLPGFLVWLRWILLPWQLSADYSPNHFLPEAYLTLRHAAAFVSLALVAALAWRWRARAPAAALGLAWCCVTASVASNILVPTGVMLAERVMYLPSVGAAVALGACWELLPRRAGVWYATATLLALLGWRSVVRTGVWRDEAGFREALIRDAPESYRAHWALAATAFERGERAAGERHYLAAVRTWPRDASLLQELGERYFEAGLYVPANRFLTASFSIDSGRSDAVVSAAIARLRLGIPDSAVSLAEAALRRFPGAPTLLAVAVDAYLSLGRSGQALALARRLTYLDGSRWEYQQLAGYAAARAGRCEEAASRLERAAALAPPENEAVLGLRARLRPGAADCGVAP